MDADILSKRVEPERGFKRPRVIFFGMECAFSSPVLQTLLTQNIDVRAIVIPATSGGDQAAICLKEPPQTARGTLKTLTVLNSPMSSSIVQMAWQRHIPVWEVSKLADHLTHETLQTYQPDLICVACFSRIIPSSLLALPRAGCLNVHPSLLPANRGPVPLFWSLRRGDEVTGVTIHDMTGKFDSGDILAQEMIPIPEGIRYVQLEERCALSGGDLLARVVWDIYRGQISSHPQDERQSSYYPYPTDDDYTVSVQNWQARHVYNFIRGVASEDTPVTLRIEERSLLAIDSLSYSLDELTKNESKEKDLQSAYAVERGSQRERGYVEWKVRCRDGWVCVLSR